MADRTVEVGSCYQFTPDAIRFPGFERMTIDGLTAYSRKWPTVYHVHIGPNGRETWVKDGSKIAESDLPEVFSKVLVGPRPR